jgi:hypothetical protein
MEAFLLSYPMVLTPKNDLALLWADEYASQRHIRDAPCVCVCVWCCAVLCNVSLVLNLICACIRYRKACSWRLDGDARKKHQANRFAFCTL